MRLFFAIFALSVACLAQRFNANTTVVTVPYPASTPCPAATCASGGNLLGANTLIVPSDFNNAMIRVTDNATMATSTGYAWTYTGGQEANPFDTTDTRFMVYTNADLAVPMAWNPATRQATKLYGNTYGISNNFSNITFSYTQPYIAYSLAFNGSSNPAIYVYDFTSPSVAPTPSQLVDLSTCVPALAGLGYKWAGDLNVSKDDQTFAVPLSSTASQGSSGAVYVVVWNRTNGCRILNTSTGAITGAWGTIGSIAVADTFTLHGAELGSGGQWVHLTATTCLNNSCAASPVFNQYFWNIATLTETPLTSNAGCGHFAIGVTIGVDQCALGGGLGQATWFQRPLSAPNPTPDSTGAINLTGQPIPGSNGFDGHPGWAMDNSSDTAPFCTSTINYLVNGTVSNPYEYEIDCIDMSGSGTVWRIAHNYTSFQSANFAAQSAIGAVSQDGKWFLFGTDFLGQLGNTDGVTNSCTLGTNCRNDAFIVAMPLSAIAVLGVSIKAGVAVK